MRTLPHGQRLALAVVLCCGASGLAQTNLVANPLFEAAANGFAADWGAGSFGHLGQTVFLEPAGGHAGGRCLRLTGTPDTWTTCSAKSIPVRPETTYWITWWCKARQPNSSRTYLFLQTNLAQRVFPQTDQRGDGDWVEHIVPYRTQPGETSLAPVLTMQTSRQERGTSWWDSVGVWATLPPELEARYRQAHPWDDQPQPTARVLARDSAGVVWAERPDIRVYPQTPAPAGPVGAPLVLTAPGRGHDVIQLIVSPKAAQAVSLRCTVQPAAGAPAADSLSWRVARCVPVKEVRDKSFPLGPTPDPLLPATSPEAAAPGRNAIFWLEWAPPPGGAAGTFAAELTVEAGGQTLATIPLQLRRWAFDLPAASHYRSMVLFSPAEIVRLQPSVTLDEAARLGWSLLASYRLSGFNLGLYPQVSLKDGRLVLDWQRFDRVLAAAKEYGASALTIGPCFGGGCSQGWLPSKFCGLTPLADPAFDALYVDLNRQIAARLEAAGLLDKAYVYPYDEPESDYMDKIARLCDLVHQGAPKLKCLMTTDPLTGQPLWGKVNAWIIPSSMLPESVIEQRRAAGDEIWIYNMTAAIEESPLEHRLYLWRALRTRAEGGLLWSANWWNKINPWDNPTAAPVPVGRKFEQLYRYQAGQASLCYPDHTGRGPLLPSLRLPLIRQGIEDFDLLTELAAAWQAQLPKLSFAARQADPVKQARAAFIAPVLLDAQLATTSAARVEGLRLTLGNELEAAPHGPAVIAWPARVAGQLAVTGWTAAGTRLTLNGRPVSVEANGRFQQVVTAADLAAGLKWTAAGGGEQKKWDWAGVR